MRLLLSIFLFASMALGHTATPVRYDMAASLASVQTTGGPSFGSKFFFSDSNQVAFRLIPAGQTEGNPATKWQYWSSSAGSRDVLPVTGDSSLEVLALNSGQIVGKSVGATTETALYWTLANGSIKPSGFNSGYNGLSAINASGLAAGYLDDGTPKVVAWDAANSANGVVTIVPPTGCTAPQIVSVSGAGEVLIYVKDASNIARLAIWDGTRSVLVGPAPTETFYPANAAISPSGDVAMLVFTAGGNAKLHYIPAADRTNYLTFTFNGPVDSSGVYNLHLSDAGIASFDTSINGANVVAVASAVERQQLVFTGYRSFLNNPGALLFGDQGNLKYWDAAEWSGQPVTVPVSASSNSGGLDLYGLNDDGHVLAILTAQTTRTLAILTPSVPQPSLVTVKPIRKLLHLRAGVRVRQQLVETKVTGDSLQSSIRYVVQGKLPWKMRFRHSEAILSGVPLAQKKFTLRVAAIYVSDGVRKQSSFVDVRVMVRPRF